MSVNNWLITDECRCKRCQKEDEHEYREFEQAVKIDRKLTEIENEHDHRSAPFQPLISGGHNV